MPVYPLLGATIHAHIGGGALRARTWALRSIVTEHRRSGFDLLHAIWGVPAGTVAAIAGGLLTRPVLLHLAGGELVAMPEIEYGSLRDLGGRLQIRLALAGADRVTAASEPMLKAAARLGCRASRVPLGVDLEAWPIRPPVPREPGAPPRLLHVGSLNRVKDHATLLRAAASLSGMGRAFRLDLVGVDTLGGEVQRAAAELGLTEQVAFHGFLTHARLRPLVERADLLVVSSRHEAGPIAFLEAAVAGVPCVGTRVGHIAEYAPEGAVAVPVADSAALGWAIAALLEDEPRRQRLAIEAQRRAIAEDAAFTAGKVEEIYEELI